MKNEPFSDSLVNGSPLSKSKNEGSIAAAVGSSAASWYGCIRKYWLVDVKNGNRGTLPQDKGASRRPAPQSFV